MKKRGPFLMKYRVDKIFTECSDVETKLKN